MSKITKQDTNGIKPLLSTGEFGYDNYPTGGDEGRVYVGTGAKNVALANKSEVAVVVETINDFPASPETGDTVIVKDLNRGGTFIYDATHSAVNNGGTVFDGWVRQYSGSVNVKWFGAVGDGIENDREAIQSAINTGTTYIPSGTFRVDSQLTVNLDNISIYGNGKSSYLKSDNGLYTLLYANGKGALSIYGLQLATIAQTDSTAYTGLIRLDNCVNCVVRDNGIFYFGYRGVYLHNSSNCIITNNIIGASFSAGTKQDSADIAIMDNSNFNTIDNNICNGQYSDHGILVQDPYTDSTPTGNSITNNKISEHNAYGIVVYVTTDYDTKTIVSNNIIRDILGSQLSGASGAGIYIQRAGGTIVSNNQVWNCMRQTTNFTTLSMGHIGVASEGTNIYPVVVSGNIVSSTRGPGIATLTSSGPVSIINNSIIVINKDNVAGIFANCIHASNCSSLSINNNKLIHNSGVDIAVKIVAINETVSNINILDNDIKASYIGVYLGAIGTGNYLDVNISDNRITGATSSALFILNGDSFTIKGNTLRSSSVVYQQGNVTNTRLTCNTMVATSAGTAFVFIGNNLETVVDESNSIRGGLINNNSGSGVLISRYGTMAPGRSGIHGVGDRVIQSVPVVGSPKGWRCTVGGNPGTWVSEGNL